MKTQKHCLVYVAHPFGGDLANADNAERWCAFLNAHIDGAMFIVPWVPMVRHWIDSGETRERGLALTIAAAKLCAGLLAICQDLSPGMADEWRSIGMMNRLRLPYVGTALPTGENVQSLINIAQPFVNFLNTGVLDGLE